MATLLGLLVVLSGGYFVYQRDLARTNLAQAPPQQQIDVIGVKSALLQIGQAERQYLVAHGAYGTLEQLRQDGPATVGADQRGYVFSVAPNASQSFTATATPTDANRAGWPTLVIDDTMQTTKR